MQEASSLRPAPGVMLEDHHAGCRHCLSCGRDCLSYNKAAAQRGHAYVGALQEFWPTGSNPKLYFLLHAGHLAHSTLAHSSDGKVWRSPSASVAAGAPSSLLSTRRGGERAAALSVRLPQAATNIGPGDAIQFSGTACQQLAALGRAQPIAAPSSCAASKTAGAAAGEAEGLEEVQPQAKRRRVA